MRIDKADNGDLKRLTGLALRLWPGRSEAEMAAELEDILRSPEAAFYIASEDEEDIGFVQCQLRRDYVEGTQSSPVGYLEGIYVAERYRRRGIAGRLLAACEAWAREQGCREFASDCELDNEESLRFHLGMGFQEANRIICFTRKL